MIFHDPPIPLPLAKKNVMFCAVIQRSKCETCLFNDDSNGWITFLLICHTVYCICFPFQRTAEKRGLYSGWNFEICANFRENHNFNEIFCKNMCKTRSCTWQVEKKCFGKNLRGFRENGEIWMIFVKIFAKMSMRRRFPRTFVQK